MIPFIIRAAFLTAILGLGAASAQDYAAAYSSDNRAAVSPPQNLRIAKGLPPMTEVSGQIIDVDVATRQIWVRDSANQVHHFIVPVYASLSRGANLHRDARALQACLHRQVRVRFIASVPGPDRFKAIDIFAAG